VVPSLGDCTRVRGRGNGQRRASLADLAVKTELKKNYEPMSCLYEFGTAVFDIRTYLSYPTP